jgi:hypothetical protein
LSLACSQFIKFFVFITSTFSTTLATCSLVYL